MFLNLIPSLANFVGFQATWWACALGAANGLPLIGPVVGICWLLAHLATLQGSKQDPVQDPRASKQALRSEQKLEVLLILGAGLIGYLCDSALVVLGLMEFPPGAGPAVPTTPWMVVLWMGFAATLRHSFNWIRRRYLIGLLLGALFAPLAYRAGEALGALTLAPAPAGLLAVAIMWLMAIPLLLWLRERLEPA